MELSFDQVLESVCGTDKDGFSKGAIIIRCGCTDDYYEEFHEYSQFFSTMAVVNIKYSNIIQVTLTFHEKDDGYETLLEQLKEFDLFMNKRNNPNEERKNLNMTIRSNNDIEHYISCWEMDWIESKYRSITFIMTEKNFEIYAIDDIAEED